MKIYFFIIKNVYNIASIKDNNFIDINFLTYLKDIIFK